MKPGPYAPLRVSFTHGWLVSGTYHTEDLAGNLFVHLPLAADRTAAVKAFSGQADS